MGWYNVYNLIMSLYGLDQFIPPGYYDTMGIAPLKKGKIDMANNIIYASHQDILDLSSVIRTIEQEDMFVREERWIMAGGDCLFSEFEQHSVRRDVPVERSWWFIFQTYNAFVLGIGAIIYFISYFFIHNL